MKTSQAGLDLITSSEGFSANVYNDNGRPAIGYGHDIQPGESFPDPITQSEALALLQNDLETRFEPAVNALIPPDCTQGQFDALVDFCFNLGPANLQTMLVHGWEDVPNQIPRWCHIGGVESKGLLARRQKEVVLFNS